MFAARVRASLKPLLNRSHRSYIIRNSTVICNSGEATANSKSALLDRYNDVDRALSSLRLTGIGVEHKRAFHSSSSQCYASKSDVGVKADTSALLSSLEDDLFSELGSVEKDHNCRVVVELLTKVPDPCQVDKPELSQKTKGTKKIKKKKKKKKDEEASDSVSKPKLLTEKPEASWKTNGKSKVEAHASSPARNVTDSFSKPTESSSRFNNGSSTKDTPSCHPSSVVVIRIGNLNSNTTDSEIHSRCLSISSFEGLARINEDSADVLFRARNMKEANSILEKLNKATVDHSQWMAELVPEAEDVSRDQMGMRINTTFEDIKTQLRMSHILVKDLEVLVHSIVHLENHPMAREGTKALQSSQEA